MPETVKTPSAPVVVVVPVGRDSDTVAPATGIDPVGVRSKTTPVTITAWGGGGAGGRTDAGPSGGAARPSLHAGIAAATVIASRTARITVATSFMKPSHPVGGKTRREVQSRSPCGRRFTPFHIALLAGTFRPYG